MRNIILRKYLCKRLAEYYSQPADNVVGSIGNSIVSGSSSPIINFSSLLNEWHWKYTYRQVYKEQNGMWLTPVELFFPYYSNVLANFVSESMSATLNNTGDGNHFDIVELGGGRGTNAMALLNHLRTCHTDMYEKLNSYTIYDTSTTLHELQRQVLMDESCIHSDKVKLVNIDMMDISEGNAPFLEPSDIPTALIACELLDNLPHDKIGRCKTGDILQAEVVPVEEEHLNESFNRQHTHNMTHLDTSIPYKEVFSPLNDPLLKHILSVAPHVYSPTISHGPRWIPTVALSILLKAFECRPNSIIAFADFDYLPPSDVSTTQQHNIPLAETSVGDPIVTDMQGNDHPCYITTPPNALCDILFPTDFERMATFATKVIEQQSNKASAMKQSDFLIKYGSDEVKKMKGWTGYCPMIDDFGNTSVFTVTQR